jgi:hypothetical protein
MVVVQKQQENTHFGRKRIISAVEMFEFVSDRMSYRILRGFTSFFGTFILQ